MNASWSRIVVDALCAAGVRDLVVSPGSRSTPLVLAALQTDASLDLHVIVDERSAAFFALGRARATATPVALLCTSGTAGAHYLPALLEAAYARVPLVAITADRPLELHGCAAPQTIDQRALFSSCARAVVELGAPEASPASHRGLRRRALGAVAASQWPEPGPVHINAPFRKPLEPTAEIPGADLASAPNLPRFLAPALAATDAAVAELRSAIAGARRGVIVAGPAPLAVDRDAVFALAAATGFPLYAEATSQLRLCQRGAAPVCDALGTVARADIEGALAPDLVVQLGAPPVAGALPAWLEGARRVVVAEHGWPDPAGTAVVLAGPIGDLCRRVAVDLGPPSPSAWSIALAAADRAAWDAVEAELADPRSEAAAVRAAIAALPDDALLVLGNSLPVRSVDGFVPGGAARVGVLHQRGASGIDGLVSGAAGAALGARPVALLVGDVSFAHDLGGLAATRHARAPLAIVVVDNAGGRIFDELPVAALPLGDDFARAWRTPPALDIESACRAFGVAYQRPADAAELGSAIAAALARPGTTVIHAVVVAGSARAARLRVDAAVAEAIACAP